MDMYITDDGSRTFRNREVDQLYHTKGGAIVEALEKHARALKVWEKDNPVIFDVCSGLSYSAACALEEIRRHDNKSEVTIYLFENDRIILEKNLELPDSLEYVQDGTTQNITCYHHFKKAIKAFLNSGKSVYESKKNHVKIIIVFGDVQSTIDLVDKNADFVFFAPFSPVATPDMWNSEIFSKLYSHMNRGGKLSTYSYARKVRDALNESNFSVHNGPILARRSPSLIALKD
jgi:tRNA U34 5-methylaminomethyl-2-thiouridine-forming methyltransferase MnmC